MCDAQRHVRGRLGVRDALVRTRTRYIALIRSRLRPEGWRVPTGTAEGRRRQSVPNIGPVTAAAFVAALDDAHRCGRAHEVEAYVGLVPREWSSGETQRRGRITQAGSGRVRWLLIQAAVSRLRRRDPRPAEQRDWAGRIAARRGKKIAGVALARRLAGILFALLRDGTVYEPRGGQSCGPQSAVPM